MPTPKKLDVAKAIKQRTKGMTYQQIADSQGVSKVTVWQRITPILNELANPETVETYRKQQADILDGLAARTVASISNADFEKAGLRDKVVATGILIDKSRLIQGMSTSNSAILISALEAADSGE